MIIDFSTTEPLQRYHLMTQTIIPRPIAWVLSLNEGQSLNLAPFSYFNAMSSDPPLLAISIGKKAGGEVKDTRRNLLSGREFVAHIANIAQAESLNMSAAPLAYGDSEVDLSQLALKQLPGWPLPLIDQCPLAYHCKLYDVHELGPNQQAVIYAEICQLYLEDRLVEYSNGRYQVDARRVNPLLRLGGSDYGELGRIFSLARPKH